MIVLCLICVHLNVFCIFTTYKVDLFIPSYKYKNKCMILTYHVQCNGARYGRHLVIVSRLTSEYGVQVTAFQSFQAQNVSHLPVRKRFESFVDQSVFLPPGNSRRWTSYVYKIKNTQNYFKFNKTWS